MDRLARHALTHPRSWLVAIGIVTTVFAAGLLRLELRTDGAALHPAEHPQIQVSAQDSERFRDPRQIVLLVRAPASAPALESPEGFRFLASLHEQIRSLPAVRAGGLVSIAGLLRVAPGSTGLSLGPYLDSIPTDPTAFAELVAELRAVPRTDGLLLSRDGRLASFYLPLSEGRPVPGLIDEVDSWLETFPAAPYELWLAGPEVAEATLGDMVLRDLAVFVPVMVVAIMLLLFLTLKSLGGVIIPMAEAVVVLIWVFGAMGWAGVPITLVTTILPVVLMAIAITDELHLLERVQTYVRVDAPAAAVEKALGEVGRPIIATSITTALGFLAFLSASVTPMRHFGFFMAFGILAALVLSFTWIPALIVSLPRTWFLVRAERNLSTDLQAEDGRAMGGLRGAFARRPGVALALGVLAVLISLPGIASLRVQDAWIDNFAPDSTLVKAEQAFNDAFWGSYRFDLVIEGEPDFFYASVGAELVENVVEIALNAPHVGGVMSYLNPLAEVARGLGEEMPLSALSPLRLADIATVTEMGENRLRLRQLVTDDGAATRVRLFANRSSYTRARNLSDYLDARLSPLMKQYPVSYHYSGELPVALVVVDSIVWNQLRSIGWALLTVAAVLFFIFSLGSGAIVAMVPVLAALAMVFGGMGYAGIPLGIATSMFAALTVGIGVDFSVHFLHRYQYERRRGLAAEAAAHAAIGTTGTVLGWNAKVLALSFLVLTLSSLSPNFRLGLLLSAAILLCYASALLFLPRLVPTIVGALAGVLLTMTLPPPVFASSATLCPEFTSAAVSPNESRSDARAEALMAAVESDFRRGPRIARIAIRTQHKRQTRRGPESAREPGTKTLWGVSRSNAERSDLLYVFSGPGRLAGTTLLMHDYLDPKRQDDMWLYLRSFEIFKKLEPTTQQVLVPGTALSYEDSRGFIPSDKFRFSLAEPSDESASAEDVTILACPRSASISKHLGYSSLLLQVDPIKRIVRRAEFADLTGRPLKIYDLTLERKLGDRHFPREVRLQHLSEGFLTTMSYEYWLPEKPPPDSLFLPKIESGKFIQRLREYAADAGLGSRIDSELAESDAQLRQFIERLERMQGGKAATRGVLLESEAE